MSKRTNDNLLGILFIVLGVIFALNMFGLHVNIFFRGWWTLFLIIPGFLSIKKDGTRLGNSFCVIFGIAMLITSQRWFQISMWRIWRLAPAILLIVLGISMIRQNNKK